jgi:hypothetical protein
LAAIERFAPALGLPAPFRDFQRQKVRNSAADPRDEPGKSFVERSLQTASQRDWDENEHPREEHGRFTPGAGVARKARWINEHPKRQMKSVSAAAPHTINSGDFQTRSDQVLDVACSCAATALRQELCRRGSSHIFGFDKAPFATALSSAVRGW